MMHHMILPKRDELQVDHVDRDKLNNTRTNLRYATARQNSQNAKRRPKENGSSRFKGVRVAFSKKTWEAYIADSEGRHITLGVWPNEVEAAEAHDAGAKFYQGEFAALNFPEKVIESTDEKELKRRAKQARGNQSGFYGVNVQKSTGNFAARITIEGKHVGVVGGFDNEEDAARAYDSAQRFYNPGSVRLNFDDSTPKDLDTIRRETRAARKNSSPYLGVKPLGRGTFAARIDIEGKGVHLGSFTDEVEAAKCVDACLRYLYGTEAKTNFAGTEAVSGEDLRRRHMGKGKLRPVGRSKFKGVSWHKANRTWTAHLQTKEVKKYLGSFALEEDAARAYDDARSAHGLPRINFPG
jgi:hypothetical protein